MSIFIMVCDVRKMKQGYKKFTKSDKHKLQEKFKTIDSNC